MSSEDSLQRAEALLERLEAARAQLAATDDPDAAIDVLTELAEIAKDVERTLLEAKAKTDAES